MTFPALLATAGSVRPLAAALAVGVGVWLLWSAWKRHPAPRGAWIAGGWALLVLAAGLLAPWAGGDRAVAIDTLLVAAAAGVFVIASGRWTSPKGRKARPIRATAGGADPGVGPATTGWRTAAVVLLAGPAALAAATAVGVALAVWWPGSEADRLVAAAFGAPLVLAAAMVWACADRRLIRTAVILAALALASLAAVALRPGAWT